MNGANRVFANGPRWDGYYSGYITPTHKLYVRFDDKGSKDCVLLSQNTTTTNDEEIIKNGINIQALKWYPTHKYLLQDGLMIFYSKNPDQYQRWFGLTNDDGSRLGIGVDGTEENRLLDFVPVERNHGLKIGFYW